jgi:hypothetical protein
MSLIRVNRFGPRGGGRKTLKVKKKAAVRQEWDVSLGPQQRVLEGGLSTPVQCGWSGAQAQVGSGGFLGMVLVLEGRAGHLPRSPLSVQD